MVDPTFESIGIIGLGNMGWSLGHGLADTPYSEDVLACDRNAEKRERLNRQTDLPVTRDWTEVLEKSDLILLCIRTEQVADFLSEATSHLHEPSILVSISAGIELSTLQEALVETPSQPVRAITNVNVASRNGFTFVLAPGEEGCSLPAPHEATASLFESLGKVRILSSEKDLDTMSILPGCLPAVVGLLLESTATFGSESGFDEVDAVAIAQQVLSDSIDTMYQTDSTPSAFKERVAAPGGVIDRLLKSQKSDRLQESSADWFRAILESIE